MTTKQIIETRIDDLERRIRVEKESSEETLKQIQQGVSDIDYCRQLIRDYDFSKEMISSFENDLKLLKLAIRAIEEEH